MALARWQATIVDDRGNIVPNANIEVRREIAGQPLVSVYSDRDGTSPLGNPFTADSEGFAAFHVVGGAYRVRAYKDGFERIWRYVGIGLAGETDLTALIPRGDWDSGTPYALGDYVYHGGHTWASLVDENLNNEPPSGDSPLGSDAFWMFIPAIQGATPENAVLSDDVDLIVRLTQAEYDGLTPDESTLYIITE